MKKIDISCTYLLILLIGLSVAFNPIRGDTIYEDIQLTATDSESGDEFGHSISLDNGVAAIGAPFDDDNGTNSGSAYLYDVSTGEQIVKLLPSDGVEGAEFGFSIAINNGIVAVGARADNENGTNAGAAYLFNASTGNQLYKLTPNDAEPNDEFGNSIAIDNDIVAVGAWRADEHGDGSGAAYLFDASTGEQLHFIYPDEVWDRDHFGISISINNWVVAIGSQEDDDNGFDSGSAYLYDALTGNEISKLLASDGVEFDLFGTSVAIEGDVTVVGAKGYTDSHTGSAYVYSGTTNRIEGMDSNLSENFALNQNYPNPFNPVTSLSYDLPEDSFVSITIYDMLGNVVNNLVNTNQSSGYKTVQWNATNNQGHPVSAGVYFYSIEAGEFRQTKKMILLK